MDRNRMIQFLKIIINLNFPRIQNIRLKIKILMNFKMKIIKITQEIFILNVKMKLIRINNFWRNKNFKTKQSFITATIHRLIMIMV